uniref:Reverse transcriptase Ty1/copia-type domain-containing protein n=1 Tax=Daphnia galeata TaxID=27404 RepID=A0A8J2RNU0_9CRUS|nr:unnamed protein product [Daphnia galeata]
MARILSVNVSKPLLKEPQTDEPAFHESDLNEVSTDINIPQEISIPLDDAKKEGAIINNEAIDEEIVYDASPNASNASPRVHSGHQVNSKGTRQSARRPKLSDRYLQYRQSIAKQAIFFGVPTKTSKSRPVEPSSYLEAISCADSEFWIPAIIEEYESLIQNNTWNLCQLPPGRKAIQGKWVLKYKPGFKSTPPRYKARFVIKGYSQIQGARLHRDLRSSGQNTTLFA